MLQLLIRHGQQVCEQIQLPATQKHGASLTYKLAWRRCWVASACLPLSDVAQVYTEFWVCKDPSTAHPVRDQVGLTNYTCDILLDRASLCLRSQDTVQKQGRCTRCNVCWRQPQQYDESQCSFVAKIALSILPGIWCDSKDQTAGQKLLACLAMCQTIMLAGPRLPCRVKATRCTFGSFVLLKARTCRSFKPWAGSVRRSAKEHVILGLGITSDCHKTA